MEPFSYHVFVCRQTKPEGTPSCLGKGSEETPASLRRELSEQGLDDKTSPRFGALFALNMLVNTRGGGTYSVKEYTGWLEGAGFEQVQVIKPPGPSDLVKAVKPHVE